MDGGVGVGDDMKWVASELCTGMSLAVADIAAGVAAVGPIGLLVVAFPLLLVFHGHHVYDVYRSFYPSCCRGDG